MIDFEEHLYNDDPNQGHPDVRTRLKDVSYFFLGNGLIQAAVQAAPAGEGTPLGLLIMNPEHLGMKREALTLDTETGLENTMLHIRNRLPAGAAKSQPLAARESTSAEEGPDIASWINLSQSSVSFTAAWCEKSGLPTVQVDWQTEDFSISELFYCPDCAKARLIREIRIKNLIDTTLEMEWRTGILQKNIKKEISLIPGKEEKIFLGYTLNTGKNQVEIDLVSRVLTGSSTVQYWGKTMQISFGSPLLDRYFNAARYQLPVVMSRTGRVDASIWQYNREWVRDQAMMAVGLILVGHHETARKLLQRLLQEFVTDEGDTIDSSEIRDTDEVELDQNGVLLYALEKYLMWTEDESLISENWNKIKAVAEFPLRDIFIHKPSGMLCNTREYWERHRAHGIKPGLELIYQVFVAIGLSSASAMARLLGEYQEALRWKARAKDIKRNVLLHPDFCLVDDRGFIKRRRSSGKVQETIKPRKKTCFPPGVPLLAKGKHFLNPDASTALPIALGFIPPDSPAADATMNHLELLWNQAWSGGGYGRYHVSSEPDSPGAWPFPSLFIARAYLEIGNFERVWQILQWLDTLPGAVSGSWFENYGARVSPPFPQVGITPWTWAEMIILLVHHILGIQPEEEHIRFRPRLLPGVEKVKGSVPVRNFRLNLNLKRVAEKTTPTFKSDTLFIRSSANEILIPYPREDIIIRTELPV